MSCIKCTNCIKHYINSGHYVRSYYFGFFFKACYLDDPMHFFWGNPYAPIWFLGKNPAGNPATIIMDQRWELLLKTWNHLRRYSHFKKYKDIVEVVFPNNQLQNYLIGFGDVVKCYSTSFQLNILNKKIYKECMDSHTLRLYQVLEKKPYVIVFRGGDKGNKEIKESIKKLTQSYSLPSKNCKGLDYYLFSNIPLLIILTPFDIAPYSITIRNMILSFFSNLKMNYQGDICSSSQNIIDFKSLTLSPPTSNFIDCNKKLLNGSGPKEIEDPKEIEEFYDCINKCKGLSIDYSMVDKCVNQCLSHIIPICNQYCNEIDDSKECEEEILKYYKKVREEFDNFINQS